MKGVAINQIVAIYRELGALLSQIKFEAADRFKNSKELVAGTEVSAEIAEADRLMAEFRFDLAREHLHRIASPAGLGDQGIMSD